MKTICSYLGGSHAYGLNGPSSDIDERGVVISTDYSEILGLKRFEQKTVQNETEDKVYRELRHFLKLLQGGNTECFETLFNQSLLSQTDEWKLITKHRDSLIDSDKLYSCLRVYCQGERHHVFGTKTGKLGSKRVEQVNKYGFSPKNAVNFIRLCFCGVEFFKNGVYPVRILDFSSDVYDALMEIKYRPEKCPPEQVCEVMDLWEKALEKQYGATAVKMKFNEALANEICLKIYGRLVVEEMLQPLFRLT